MAAAGIPNREGASIAKYQGVGSPERKGRSQEDGEEDKEEMFDYSPIQSIEEDDKSSLDMENLSLEPGAGTRSKNNQNTLDNLKILFTGKFNVNLDDWREDVEDHGGTVTADFLRANIAVVSESPNNKGLQYLKAKEISCMDLKGLQKVVDGEVSIINKSKRQGRYPLPRKETHCPQSTNLQIQKIVWGCLEGFQ